MRPASQFPNLKSEISNLKFYRKRIGLLATLFSELRVSEVNAMRAKLAKQIRKHGNASRLKTFEWRKEIDRW